MKHCIKFIGLQETQISNYSNIDVKGCWDATEMDFEGVDSARRSSGLVMGWHATIMTNELRVKG